MELLLVSQREMQLVSKKDKSLAYLWGRRWGRRWGLCWVIHLATHWVTLSAQELVVMTVFHLGWRTENWMVMLRDDLMARESVEQKGYLLVCR